MCNWPWPDVVLPAFGTDLRQGAGQIEGKFMRFGVLAGVISATAVVAQVCDLRDVRVREGPQPGDRWEGRAIAFAITARIADPQLPPRLLIRFC